jgi:fumarate reductase (CoM/CoB) subunit B
LCKSELLVRIVRSDPLARAEFSIAVDAQTYLGDVLLAIQADCDPSLAFRANCGTGQCGTCVVEANGSTVRICDTRISQAVGEERVLTLRPVGGVTIRDLVTDMDGRVWRLIEHIGKDDGLGDPMEIKRRVEDGWLA